MIEQENRTFICSVVYFDIADYSTKSVEVQIRLKEQLNRFTSEAIKNVADNERIILDTGDGAAICFLGDPEDALFAAMNLRNAVAAAPEDASGTPLRVRFGINLGPVKVVNDINNRKNIIGDGINVGQRIMSFAEPGQILVSRSFYDVVSCLTQEYSQLFHYIGTRSDKHIRRHEVYAIISASDQGKPIPQPDPIQPDQAIPSAAGIDTGGRISASDTDFVQKENPKRETRSPSTTSFKRSQRQQTSGYIYGAGIAVFAAVILFVLFQLYSGNRPVKTDQMAPPLPTPSNSPVSSPPVILPPVEKTTAEKTIPPTPTPAPTMISSPLPTPPEPDTALPPESSVPSQPIPSSTPENVGTEKTETEIPLPSPPGPDPSPHPETPTEPRPEPSPVQENTVSGQKTQPDVPAALAEAMLLFAVTPWGEVYVDGKHLGASPPLISLPISPGKHVIEITNPAFEAFLQTIDVTPNEKLKISHKFK